MYRTRTPIPHATIIELNSHNDRHHSPLHLLDFDGKFRVRVKLRPADLMFTNRRYLFLSSCLDTPVLLLHRTSNAASCVLLISFLESAPEHVIKCSKRKLIAGTECREVAWSQSIDVC